jgi:hypothetical protein
MRALWKTTAAASLALAATLADVDLAALRLPATAHAIVGRPMTPGSAAGVARRTVRRTGRAYATVAATTAVTATAVAATQSAARAAQPPPPPAPAPPPPGSSVPLGTIVTTLPAGCVSTPISGVNYFDCRGVYYRAAFQSNNLVYVVSQP